MGRTDLYFINSTRNNNATLTTKKDIIEMKTKKRRVSKKRKKSWRKYIDIKDVEAFLDDKRLEERMGPPLSEQADSQLFIIDTATDTAKTSKRAARLALREKEARCFASLKPHTQVPDPITRRNHVKIKEKRKFVPGTKIRIISSQCVNKSDS